MPETDATSTEDTGDPGSPSTESAPLYLVATSFITGDQLETYLAKLR